MKTTNTEAENYAIQQFTGMHYSGGKDVEAVCIGMGLQKEEWEHIKEDCSWLSEEELATIEEYVKSL